MKKTALMLFLLTVVFACAFAQEITVPETVADDTNVSVATVDMDIQIKALMPDISMVKIKTDTYAQPGNYKYSIDLKGIQKESNMLLRNWQQEINNWLEESK